MSLPLERIRPEAGVHSHKLNWRWVARTRFKPEEIIAKLQWMALLQGQRKSAAEAIRRLGATEVANCRWRRGRGGLKTYRLKRLERL